MLRLSCVAVAGSHEWSRLPAAETRLVNKGGSTTVKTAIQCAGPEEWMQIHVSATVVDLMPKAPYFLVLWGLVDGGGFGFVRHHHP